MLLHDESPAAVEARENAFLVKTYARTPFHPRDGKGARLFDADGRAYWDLLGGIAVNVLGHKHPRLVKTLRSASDELLHVSNLYYHPAQGILGEQLVRASGLLRAFFCNSGTEANEAALKFARLATRRRRSSSRCRRASTAARSARSRSPATTPIASRSSRSFPAFRSSRRMTSTR